MRKCRDCGLEATNEEELLFFIPDKESKHGRRNLCRTCANTRNSKQNPDDRARWKTDHQVKTRYHCTLAEYEERMASSSQCQICSKTTDLVYDHNHDTMKFRGVLCRACNRSIGQLGDTLESLQRAVNYLTNYSGE